MVFTNADITSSLKKYFGFESFKGEQRDIVKSVLDKKNTFVIMPTGGGKSLCYQLPAMMMEGTAIIISPLIALMKNYRVGFELGRRWPFSSSNAMYIRLRHDIEQVSFSGPATSPDRVTGATPDGVGVTNGTTVIQFGFDWGQ